MRGLTAQLAGGGRNADRVLITENAVLVLDGASAFEPVPVDPGEYAEILGHTVARQLVHDPDVSIADAVAAGISTAAEVFNLRPGRSPSSTIAILRTRDRTADLFVLGDSSIWYGTPSSTRVLRDERLSTIAEPQRAAYVAALRAGHGYDSEHREALVALQRAQREHRNRPGGYWIAEADPEAARYAITETISEFDAAWAVLGTDGATDLITHLGLALWSEIARYDEEQLSRLLQFLDRWERVTDPDGQALPRAKRHDDKTLAVVASIFCN